MKIKCKFAELHSTLFLEGNLGQKLSTKNKPNMRLTYDNELKELIVEINGKATVLPSTSVFSYVPIDLNDIGVESINTDPKQPAPVLMNGNGILQGSAQVWNPTKPVEGLTSLQGAPKYVPHDQMPKVEAHAPTEEQKRRGRPPGSSNKE